MTAVSATANLAAPIDSDDAQVSEIDPVDVPQITTVTGYVITLTMEALAAFGKSMAGAARELLDGLAGEFTRVIGSSLRDNEQAYLQLGDPIACV